MTPDLPDDDLRHLLEHGSTAVAEPEHRRGDPAPAGMIFFCSSETRAECIDRKLFGLPLNYIHLVKRLQPGTKVFLYDTSRQELHAGFETTSAGGLDLEGDAWCHLRDKARKFRRVRGRSVALVERIRKHHGWFDPHVQSLFAAQVRVDRVDVCPPLRAVRWKPLLRTERNHLVTPALTRDELDDLLDMFSEKRMAVYKHPPSPEFAEYLGGGSSGDEEDEDEDEASADASSSQEGGGAVASAPTPRQRAGMTPRQAQAWMDHLTAPPLRDDNSDRDCIVCWTSGAETDLCQRSACPRRCSPPCCEPCMEGWLISHGTCFYCHSVFPRQPPSTDDE